MAAAEGAAVSPRQRREPRDALPTPSRLDAELREIVGMAIELERVYRRAYVLGLAPRGGGMGLAHSGRGTSPVEAALEARAQQRMRDQARRAVGRIRDAAKALGNALADLRQAQPSFLQPPRPAPNAVVSLAEFLESLEAKRRREERGEE